jgi:uncharacterized protein (DUF58 family)
VLPSLLVTLGFGPSVLLLVLVTAALLLLTQLLPGQFTLRMSPEQMAKARLRAGHERPMTIRAEGDFISGQDFELQLLAR